MYDVKHIFYKVGGVIIKDNINDIVKKFGFKLIKKISRKNYCIAYTDKGVFYIKKVDYDISKILFINSAKEYVVHRGLDNVDRYMILNRKPYIEYDNNLYVMTKWIKGRKYDAANLNELKKASMMLARFHDASMGYIPVKNRGIVSNMGKLQKSYLEKCQDYIYIKSLVKMRTQKDKIDNLYLANFDNLYNMGIESVKMLQNNGYFEFCQHEAAGRYLCHNDYNHNNTIIDENDQLNIINFDNCRFELRCYDIAKFIIDAMDKLNWNFQKSLDIFESYNQKRNIKEIEYKLMASFIQFPQDIWEIVTKYYYEEYGLFKNKYYKSLKDRIEKLPYKIDFLNKYKKEFKLKAR